MISTEYVAGLFDGEGSVGIYPFGKWKSLQLRCQIALCNEDVVGQLKEKYGGFTTSNLLKSGKAIHKWYIGSNKAEAFLRDIRPHSIVKREQIEAAINFQEQRGNYLDWRKGQSGYEGIPKVIKEAREILRSKVNSGLLETR